MEKNKEWFEYMRNERYPQHSMYRCRLCTKYYDSFGLDSRYKNAIAYPEGTLKFKKYENKDIISKHANIPGHKAIVQQLQQKSEKRLSFHFEFI